MYEICRIENMSGGNVCMIGGNRRMSIANSFWCSQTLKLTFFDVQRVGGSTNWDVACEVV